MHVKIGSSTRRVDTAAVVSLGSTSRADGVILKHPSSDQLCIARGGQAWEQGSPRFSLIWEAPLVGNEFEQVGSLWVYQVSSTNWAVGLTAAPPAVAAQIPFAAVTEAA